MTSAVRISGKVWRAVASLALATSMVFTGAVSASAAPDCVINLSAAESKPYGAPTNVWGTTSGCASGTLLAQVRDGSSWKTIGRVSADGTGRFVAHIQGITDAPGTYEIRATLGGTSSATTTFVRLDRMVAHSAGSKYIGQGTNTWGTAPGQANRPVWTEVLLGSRWSMSQRGTTRSDGSFVLPLTYGINTTGTWKYRVAVQDASGAVVRSEPFSLARKPRPTAHAAKTKFIGQGANTWGTAPGQANRPVWTEVLLGSRWSMSQRGTTQPDGSFVLPLTYGINTTGTWKYRVGVQEASGQTIYTNTMSLERLPRPTLSTAGRVAIGAKTNGWGHFPRGARIPVWTEVRLPNGTWSRSQTSTTSSSGFYAIPLTYGAYTPGTYQYRVAGRYPDGQVVRTNTVTFRRTNPAYNLDSRCYSGARVMCASKKDRKLYYVMDGKVVKVLDARFGARSNPTRNGVHYVYWKSRHHVSSIYGTAMPWAMFFDGGQAVHYSSNFTRVGWNHPGSGGCINIRDAKTLDWIYKQIRNGDKVVVY
uniref:L,D-transpeptidase n=1 Tax=Tessaracoccus timonensis TaxID=2161816 RepID=UPI001E477A95|nr:L,D-transpeptidase [Tessaracoccus timonensis]